MELTRKGWRFQTLICIVTFDARTIFGSYHYEVTSAHGTANATVRGRCEFVNVV